MFEKLPITQIRLVPGRTVGSPSQTLSVNGLTVFVGPNNSGKSLALREIARFALSPSDRTPATLVDSFTLSALTDEEIDFVRLRFTGSPPANEAQRYRELYFHHRIGKQWVSEDTLLNVLRDPVHQDIMFRFLFLSNFTVHLSGENRINLVMPQQAGDLDKPDPFKSLPTLFTNDNLRLELREILYKAFGRYFIIDPLQNGQLRIRYSDNPPDDVVEEQGLHKAARLFHSNAVLISELSDGMKAYTGMMCEIVAGEPKVMLIDEPEAFLHPPLAFQLGKEIARQSYKGKKNVFISTHSSHFVVGCLQSSVPIDIVRLTYRNGVATARVLKNDDISILTKHPLLRSTGVINALFYESVVVTESDSDRAFYQEINERLLACDPPRGIPNCLFLNAQNKQTTRIITKPLRALGIPTVSIVDIDVLKEGGSVWSDFLASAYIPQLDRSSFSTSREVLNAALKKTGKDMKKDGGIDLLDIPGKEALTNFFNRLEEYGLFVVRGGEAECWLPHLGAKGHGSEWLIDIFERMGSEPNNSTYETPGISGVWKFLERAGQWLVDPKRKGIPD